MQKCIQPPACSDHGLHKILFSYWLAHFYLMKKSAKMLLYFSLNFEKVGILYSRIVIQRTIGIEHMQTVIQTSRRLDSFLHEAAQNFELLSNI
jgi:hypothetical protein